MKRILLAFSLLLICTGINAQKGSQDTHKIPYPILLKNGENGQDLVRTTDGEWLDAQSGQNLKGSNIHPSLLPFLHILYKPIYRNEIKLRTSSPPANDDLCNATPTNFGAAVSIDLTDATAQANEPDFDCIGSEADTMVYNSVWYQFTGGSLPITIIIDPEAALDTGEFISQFQMDLFGLSGDCADLMNLTPVACKPPIGGLWRGNALLFTPVQDSTYYLRISGAEFTFDEEPPFSATGTLTIFEIGGSASNDNVCNAIPLSFGAGPQTFDNYAATVQEGENDLAPTFDLDNPFAIDSPSWAQGENSVENSVWFTFTTPPNGGTVTVDLLSSINLAGSFNPQVAVFEAGDCNDFSTFNLVGSGDNSIIPINDFIGRISVAPSVDLFCLPGNTTYYIMVDGASSFFFRPIDNQGFFSIELNVTELPPITSNSFVEAPDCVGGDDGTIFVNGAGGAGDFQYHWNTGDSTNTLRGLASGSYILTITDFCLDTAVDTFVIGSSNTEALSYKANEAQDTLICEGTALSLGGTASGGLPIDDKRVFLMQFTQGQSLLFLRQELQRPEVLDTINPATNIQFIDLEFAGDDLYGVDSENRFYQINTSTGEATFIDSIATGGSLDLSYVPSSGKLYHLTRSGRLYEVEPSNGDTTFVLQTANTGWQACIDNSGQLYLLTLFDGIIKIDINTGMQTATLGFDGNSFAIRSMEIDPSTDKLYITSSFVLSFTPGSPGWIEFRELDKMTGLPVASYRNLETDFNTAAFAIKSSDVGPYEYTWSPAALFMDPSLASQTVSPDSSTAYSLMITDACAQAITEQFSVQVDGADSTQIDTSIVAGGTYGNLTITADTILVETLMNINGCDSIVTTNISVLTTDLDNELSSEAFRILPNPVRDQLNIFTQEVPVQGTRLYVWDIQGRLVLKQPLNGIRSALDVSSLRSGHYILELRTAEKVGIRRFVKQ